MSMRVGLEAHFVTAVEYAPAGMFTKTNRPASFVTESRSSCRAISTSTTDASGTSAPASSRIVPLSEADPATWAEDWETRATLRMIKTIQVASLAGSMRFPGIIQTGTSHKRVYSWDVRCADKVFSECHGEPMALTEHPARFEVDNENRSRLNDGA